MPDGHRVQGAPYHALTFHPGRPLHCALRWTGSLPGVSPALCSPMDFHSIQGVPLHCEGLISYPQCPPAFWPVVPGTHSNLIVNLYCVVSYGRQQKSRTFILTQNAVQLPSSSHPSQNSTQMLGYCLSCPPWMVWHYDFTDGTSVLVLGHFTISSWTFVHVKRRALTMLGGAILKPYTLV